MGEGNAAHLLVDRIEMDRIERTKTDRSGGPLPAQLISARIHFLHTIPRLANFKPDLLVCNTLATLPSQAKIP